MGEAGEPEKYTSEWTIYLRNGMARTGWSVAELARRAGISRQTIFNWLSGKVRTADAALVECIADAFGDDPANAGRARFNSTRDADPRLLGLDNDPVVLKLLDMGMNPDDPRSRIMIRRRKETLQSRKELMQMRERLDLQEATEEFQLITRQREGAS